MPAKTVTLLIALLVSLPASAEPIKLHCRPKGEMFANYGRLSVLVDPDARWVEIEAEKWPGFLWRYSNGEIGPTMTEGPEWVLKLDIPARVPVVHFVNVTPQWITVGARDVDGDLVKVSTFDRSALGTHGAACRWHSSEEFGVG